MRIKILNVVVSILFLALVLCLFYTQVIKSPLYIKLSRNNRIRIVPILAPRGNIFDRNGKTLAANRAFFDCVAIPQELTDKEEAFSKLSQMLGVEKSRLSNRFKEGALSPFTPVPIAKNISKDKVFAIEEERLNLPGIFVSVRPVRDYLYNEACAHLIGYIGEIGQEELERLDRYGYRMNDWIGKIGIEKRYDNYLRGKNGGMQIEVDNRGRQQRILGSRRPEPGNAIYLTIDIEMQKFISDIFEGRRGACVVMDPRNGEVLSLVSQPAFDPNLFVSSDSRIKDILRNPRQPMLNRAISCAYPPGSSFKIAVAVAGVEEGKITDDKYFVCSGEYKLGGRVFHCWKEEGHGAQNITEGIKNSCNIFFYNTGLLLGVDTISRYAQKFGFGRPTGIDLPGEVGGFIPSKIWKRISTGTSWYEGDTVNYSIGQGYLLSTPIQMVRMISATANGGFLVRPHVIKKIESIEVSTKIQREVGVSNQTLKSVIRGLRKVVEDDSGTGVFARVPGISIAGKTGTAQTGRGTTHAWFVGFSPINGPKLALVVFLEEGGKGGLSAAQVAGQIFRKAKELNLL